MSFSVEDTLSNLATSNAKLAQPDTLDLSDALDAPESMSIRQHQVALLSLRYIYRHFTAFRAGGGRAVATLLAHVGLAVPLDVVVPETKASEDPWECIDVPSFFLNDAPGATVGCKTANAKFPFGFDQLPRKYSVAEAYDADAVRGHRIGTAGFRFFEVGTHQQQGDPSADEATVQQQFCTKFNLTPILDVVVAINYRGVNKSRDETFHDVFRNPRDVGGTATSAAVWSMDDELSSCVVYSLVTGCVRTINFACGQEEGGESPTVTELLMCLESEPFHASSEDKRQLLPVRLCFESNWAPLDVNHLTNSFYVCYLPQLDSPRGPKMGGGTPLGDVLLYNDDSRRCWLVSGMTTTMIATMGSPITQAPSSNAIPYGGEPTALQEQNGARESMRLPRLQVPNQPPTEKSLIQFSEEGYLIFHGDSGTSSNVKQASLLDTYFSHAPITYRHSADGEWSHGNLATYFDRLGEKGDVEFARGSLEIVPQGYWALGPGTTDDVSDAASLCRMVDWRLISDLSVHHHRRKKNAKRSQAFDLVNRKNRVFVTIENNQVTDTHCWPEFGGGVDHDLTEANNVVHIWDDVAEERSFGWILLLWYFSSDLFANSVEVEVTRVKADGKKDKREVSAEVLSQLPHRLEKELPVVSAAREDMMSTVLDELDRRGQLAAVLADARLSPTQVPLSCKCLGSLVLLLRSHYVEHGECHVHTIGTQRFSPSQGALEHHPLEYPLHYFMCRAVAHRAIPSSEFDASATIKSALFNDPVLLAAADPVRRFTSQLSFIDRLLHGTHGYLSNLGLREVDLGAGGGGDASVGQQLARLFAVKQPKQLLDMCTPIAEAAVSHLVRKRWKQESKTSFTLDTESKALRCEHVHGRPLRPSHFFCTHAPDTTLSANSSSCMTLWVVDVREVTRIVSCWTLVRGTSERELGFGQPHTLDPSALAPGARSNWAHWVPLHADEDKPSLEWSFSVEGDEGLTIDAVTFAPSSVVAPHGGVVLKCRTFQDKLSYTESTTLYDYVVLPAERPSSEIRVAAEPLAVLEKLVAALNADHGDIHLYLYAPPPPPAAHSGALFHGMAKSLVAQSSPLELAVRLQLPQVVRMMASANDCHVRWQKLQPLRGDRDLAQSNSLLMEAIRLLASPGADVAGEQCVALPQGRTAKRTEEWLRRVQVLRSVKRGYTLSPSCRLQPPVWLGEDDGLRFTFECSKQEKTTDGTPIVATPLTLVPDMEGQALHAVAPRAEEVLDKSVKFYFWTRPGPEVRDGNGVEEGCGLVQAWFQYGAFVYLDGNQPGANVVRVVSIRPANIEIPGDGESNPFNAGPRSSGSTSMEYVPVRCTEHCPAFPDDDSPKGTRWDWIGPTVSNPATLPRGAFVVRAAAKGGVAQTYHYGVKPEPRKFCLGFHQRERVVCPPRRATQRLAVVMELVAACCRGAADDDVPDDEDDHSLDGVRDRFGLFSSSGVPDLVAFTLLFQMNAVSVIRACVGYVQEKVAVYASSSFKTLFMRAPTNRLALEVPINVLSTAGFETQWAEDHGLTPAMWCCLLEKESNAGDSLFNLLAPVDPEMGAGKAPTSTSRHLKCNALHFCAYSGNVEGLKRLLDGVDVDDREDLLLKHQKCHRLQLEADQSAQGPTPVHLAVMLGPMYGRPFLDAVHLYSGALSGPWAIPRGAGKQVDITPYELALLRGRQRSKRDPLTSLVDRATHDDREREVHNEFIRPLYDRSETAHTKVNKRALRLTATYFTPTALLVVALTLHFVMMCASPGLDYHSVAFLSGHFEPDPTDPVTTLTTLLESPGSSTLLDAGYFQVGPSYMSVATSYATPPMDWSQAYPDQQLRWEDDQDSVPVNPPWNAAGPVFSHESQKDLSLSSLPWVVVSPNTTSGASVTAMQTASSAYVHEWMKNASSGSIAAPHASEDTVLFVTFSLYHPRTSRLFCVLSVVEWGVAGKKTGFVSVKPLVSNFTQGWKPPLLWILYVFFLVGSATYAFRAALYMVRKRTSVTLWKFFLWSVAWLSFTWVTVSFLSTVLIIHGHFADTLREVEQLPTTFEAMNGRRDEFLSSIELSQMIGLTDTVSVYRKTAGMATFGALGILLYSLVLIPVVGPALAQMRVFLLPKVIFYFFAAGMIGLSLAFLYFFAWGSGIEEVWHPRKAFLQGFSDSLNGWLLETETAQTSGTFFFWILQFGVTFYTVYGLHVILWVIFWASFEEDEDEAEGWWLRLVEESIIESLETPDPRGGGVELCRERDIVREERAQMKKRGMEKAQ